MHRLTLKFNFFYPIILLSLLVIAFYNIFYRLENFPISSWDEARHGVSAYEMLKRGNFIVSTYRNDIDYWNLKPPLSFWANIAGYKLAGFNALGLRLFSALSAMLTIILVAIFVYKKHGRLASLISTLTLTTCTQFLINHSARTGDADSLFVFLFTASIMSLLLCEHNLKWLYGSGLGFALAFLTKSWHAGNIAIIIGLYLLFTGTYKRLNHTNWILLLICMVFPILAWGGIRYQYDGLEFFKNMFAYDLLQRSSTTIEGHLGGTLYYLEILWRFFNYWLAILYGLVLVYANKDFSFKQFLSEKNSYKIGICLWVIIPLLLFSLAKTKIRWYILPVYPPLSVIIGVLASKLLLIEKLGTKITLLASILFVSFHYEGEIQAYLNKPTPKLQLNLIQKIHDIEKLKGYSLFLHLPSSPAKWAQNMVLTSELYTDSQVEDGGMNEFLKKDKALLLLQKGKGTKQLIKANQFIIIASNKWGYIVRKSK
ncbi:ArnT family glycosyltransferase [Neobacillus ginsengisoli]|uniref:4-amino-4-deoxy-L-arabinose transferase-like glycosyltransferase n=1 Tax=Neobacillus ginsengisoli TaxID=904295 RepID=A0ABT9Y320_9BACI|nr:glycosyltransferase family 39 protein [Neobacillus ginsengisoli]MDQ0202202.1 4-amino-4-deoxy-L-arabinose transferase-like glycosyltransferase [Neobacillus ginsengisoli]